MCAEGYRPRNARNAGKRYDLVVAGMVMIGLIGLLLGALAASIADPPPTARIASLRCARTASKPACTRARISASASPGSGSSRDSCMIAQRWRETTATSEAPALR